MKLIISGKGGHGVKFLGKVLAEILVKLNYEVALTFDFDAAVRGGDSIAFLVYSEEKIDNPTIDEADIFVRLSQDSKDFPSKKTIYDISGKPMNMHALGTLLGELNLSVTEGLIKDALPDRNKEENLSIITGYLR